MITSPCVSGWGWALPCLIAVMSFVTAVGLYGEGVLILVRRYYIKSL